MIYENDFIIMKKLLFILPVLLFSTVQIEAMQDNNTQLTLQNNNEQILSEISNILNKFQLDKIEKGKILRNISEINDENTLYWLSKIINKLPSDETTADILINISNINNKSTCFILSNI